MKQQQLSGGFIENVFLTKVIFQPIREAIEGCDVAEEGGENDVREQSGEVDYLSIGGHA